MSRKDEAIPRTLSAAALWIALGMVERMAVARAFTNGLGDGGKNNL